MAEIQGLATAVLETTEALVVVLDTQGRITFFNRACEALTGFSRNDVLGKAIWETLIPKRYVTPVKQVFTDLAAGERELGRSYENPWVTQDGRERTIAWSNSAFTDASGAVTHVIGTGMDVTERRRAEEALRATNQTLEALIQASPLAIMTLDTSRNVTGWNPAAERIFGWTAREALGRTLPFVPEESRAESAALIGRVMRGEALSNMELHRRRKDGSPVHISLSTAPLLDAEGRMSGAMGVAADVTERVLTQERLRQSEQFYRAVVDATDAGVAQYDLRGSRVYASEAFARRHGKTVEELLNGRLADQLPQEEREGDWELFHRCIATGKPQSGFLHRIEREGKVIYTRGNFAPLFGADGRVTGVQVTSVDVTELVRAQQQLRHAEELYRSVTDTTEAALARFDLEGRRTFVNEGLVRRLGKPAEELLEGRIGDTLTPDEAKKARRAFRACIETGKPSRGQIEQVVTGDGRGSYVKADYVPLRDAAGAITGVQVTSVDVTELVQAQKKLRESDALYRNVVAATDVGIARFALDGRRTFVNETFARRNAQPVEKLLAGRVGDLLEGADRDKTVRAFEQCAASGVTVQSIVTRAVIGGRTIFTRADFSPALGPDGKVIGVQSTSVDITDLMEAQESLKRSEEMYRSLVESIGGAVIRVNREGRRTFVSQPASRFTGRQWDELLAGRFGDTMATEQKRREAWALLEETFRTGKPVRAFTTRQMLHGKLRHVAANWEPIRDSQGNVAEIQMTSFDVTDQVEAQERLRQSEQLYRSLMDAVPVAVVRVKRDGERTFASTRAAELSGMSEEEFLKGRFGDPMVPEDREKAMAHLAEVFGTGQPVRNFVNRQMHGSEERFFSTTLVPIKDPAGEVVEVQASTVDVTELRRLQDQYLQAQKMGSVGRLAGGVAHDFNNLLTAILGYSELGVNALPEGHPVRDYLEEIQRTGERAAQLTRQLLTFSRRQVAQPQVLNLNELIQNMDKMLRRLIGEDVQVRMSLAQDLGRVRADPGLVEQVLVNLAVNSRDAMANGGTLTIETRNVALREEPTLPAGDYVEVSVSDTGTGIPEDVMRHVFEPFFTTKPHGTGLGLSTCYGIVKQSGGDIQLRSDVGKGTTAVIYLPRVEESASESAEAEDSGVLPTGTETVLLVEDDASVRRLAARALTRQGYSVLDEADGHEALSLLAQEPELRVHLLLTDVVMPNMGGKELAERLRALRPNVKVLFISGYTDDAVARHGVLEPGVQLLNKPFSAAELARKVRAALDS